ARAEGVKSQLLLWRRGEPRPYTLKVDRNPPYCPFVEIAAVKNTIVVGASPPAKVHSEVPSRLIAGLSELLRAFDYATDAGGDVWDFAIEITELRSAGMTTSDIRWLVSKGFAQHGQET